ncbi:MAG: MBL fold metallo-hydrolase [Oscillibacter sp.]|nr:MBL fold metallo-hydrolase [Oscillibacter sp.]
MKVITLLENTACGTHLTAARGLSLYVETKSHNILFDMGPGPEFLRNAAALGASIPAVDTAILSHGHSDHGGGLSAFCEENRQANIYLRQAALGAYYAVLPGQDPGYIGLPTGLERFQDRFVFTGETHRLDEGILLFSGVEDDPSLRAKAPKLQEKTAGGFRPDDFAHEQHLLVEEDGRALLLTGCGHLGILNTLRAAQAHLGRLPDVVCGGFHLFELAPGSRDAEDLIARTAACLAQGNTVYYTGHCTGEWAYSQLKAHLGDRLRPMTGGTVIEL